jgi:sugar lactone lactonase YvrE
VVRIRLSIPAGTPPKAPSVTSETTIGTELPERTDPAALVVGPTGLGLANTGTLYVADSAANRVAAMPNAVSATGPILPATPGRGQVAVKMLDTARPNGNGTVFGLAVVPGGAGVYFVDDGTNTLNVLH